MLKSRFTDAQIVAILNEAEAGLPLADVLREHNISRPTLYNWRSPYGGASVAELAKLTALEAEHAKLKRMYVELALEDAAIKAMLSRNGNAVRALGRRGDPAP